MEYSNEERFWVCIDNIQYKEKPKNEDMGVISNRITNQVKFATINELQQAVSNGQTFCGSIFKQKNGIRERKQENFAMQKIFAIDVDEKHDENGNKIEGLEYGVLFDEVQDIINQYHLPTQFAYKTLSDGIKGERFRLVFETDTYIYDKNLARAVILALQHIFPAYCDKNCKDTTRMYLGGKEIIRTENSNFNSILNLDTLFRILSEVYISNYKKSHKDISQLSRDFRTYLASNFGINTLNSKPWIRKVQLTNEQVEVMMKKRIDDTDVLPNCHFSIDTTTYDEVFCKNLSNEASNLYYIYYRTGRQIDKNVQEFYEICMINEKSKKRRSKDNTDLKFHKNVNITENVDRQTVLEKEMLAKCQLIKELYDNERHFHNEEIFGLSLNFRYLNIEYIDTNNKKRGTVGEKYFLNLMKKYCEKNNEEYEKRWDKVVEYNQKVNYSPKFCEGFCPYCKNCNHNANIINTVTDKNRIVSILNQEKNYSELSSTRDRLYKEEKEMLQRFNDNQGDGEIKIIKCQTGVGKTYQMIKSIKELLPVLNYRIFIAVERNDLKRQVEEDFRKNGIEVFVTPDFDNLNDKTLADELNRYRARGLFGKLKERIQEYIDDEDISHEDKLTLENYINSGRLLKEETNNIILTTHKKLLYLPKEALDNSIVIIDEDIINTLNEQNDFLYSDIKFISNEIRRYDELKRLYKKLMKKLEDISSSNYKKYISVKKINCNKDERKILENVVINGNYNCNIFQFLESEIIYFFNPDNNENSNITDKTVVKTIRKNKLPNNNIMILSATIEKDFYDNLYPDRNISMIELEKAKYKGKVYQYGNLSFSKDCIENHGDIIEAILYDNMQCKLITFRDILEKYNLEGEHFFATTGLNKLEGNNIKIVGLPNRNQMYYTGLAYNIYGKEYTEVPSMSFQNVELNGYKTIFYTFNDIELRRIHIWSVMSELEQAVGRARLLTNDKVVLVFAGLPVDQAIVINSEEEMRNTISNIIAKCHADNILMTLTATSILLNISKERLYIT